MSYEKHLYSDPNQTHDFDWIVCIGYVWYCGTEYFATVGGQPRYTLIYFGVLRNRFSGITWANVEHDAKIQIQEPNPSWRNIADCGVTQDCSGLKNVVMKDMDGSFLGGAAGNTIVSSNYLAVDHSQNCTFTYVRLTLVPNVQYRVSIGL